jgi:hypothetical protein
MPAGQMALTPSGLGRFHAEDLSAAGLDELVTIDDAVQLMRLRIPRQGETPRKFNRPTKGGPATIAMGGALLAMGLAPKDVSGRHDVAIDDGQLIVTFARQAG